MSSKVAVIALLIFVFHILIISAFVHEPVSTAFLLAGLLGIVGLLLLSSVYKFRHAGVFSVLFNSVVFYFYSIGRLFAVRNIALGKRGRASYTTSINAAGRKCYGCYTIQLYAIHP